MAAARLTAFSLALALALAPSALAAQDLTCDPGDLEVLRLTFEGNTTFSDGQLAQLINTTPTSWLRRWTRSLGRRRCLDSRDFPLDRLRLLVFYRNKGFDRATVDTAVTPLGRNGVEVVFRINEGTPILIDSVVVRGLDSVARRADHLRRMSIGPGRLFDRYAIDSAQASLARGLRSAGYPRAQVLRSFSTNAETRTATVELTAVTGPFARIGRVIVDTVPRDSLTRTQISTRTVLSIFGVDSGDVYSESELVAGQRRLYETDAYRSVRVELDSASLRQPGDSLQTIHLRVAEGAMQTASIGAGWGTLDCFRVQGGYSNINFLGGARRLDLSARVSKIGVGKPLEVDVGPIKSENVCYRTSVRDQYGGLANYYLGATLRQPVLFGVRSLPTLTLYREVRSEYNAFLRTTPIGGVATLTSNRRPRLPLTLSYRLEAGRTEASPGFFCAIQQICDAADRERATSLLRLAVASASIARNRTDNLVNPGAGSLMRLDLRHASPLIFSDHDLQFNTAVADAAWYMRLGSGVLAARVRGGSVFGTHLPTAFSDRGSFVPPQERLYAGGPNSVRGFRQNELGPKVYLALGDQDVDSVATAPGADTYFLQVRDLASVRVVPVGGNSMVVGNLEYRTRSPFFPNLLQLAAFTDVGEVWNRGAKDLNFGFLRFNITPGVGVRALTAFGAVRLDLAYNGYATRFGPVYLDQGFTEAGGGRLFCVSPDNTLTVAGSGSDRVQQEGSCPPSYQPDTRSSFRRRLTPSISIGQAF